MRAQASTIGTGRGDVSSVRPDTSAPESSLFYAYRNTNGTEVAKPCACGGTVYADVMDPMPGVARHQRTMKHAGWRAWQELAS